MRREEASGARAKLAAVRYPARTGMGGWGSDPRVPLGYTSILLGSNINTAEQLGKDAIRDHTLQDDRFNMASACVLLTMAARVQGKYEEGTIPSEKFARDVACATAATG